MKWSPVEAIRSLVLRLVPSGGIAEQTIKSGIWAAIINFSDRFLQLGMVIILARLLDPSDFGLLGIALLSVAVMRKFTKLGLNTALIQDEEENVDHYMNTVWMLQIARGLVIVGIAYVAAPYVAGFFDEPRTTDVLRVVALSPLLIGLRNPYIVYLRKNLEFHLEFVYRIAGTVMQVATGIALAVIFRNVWALVVGNLVGHVVRTLVSYLIASSRPRPAFDTQRARELVNYGKWITGLSVFGFLFGQGDDAFVGWLLGATALGFYQTAYRFSQSPSTEITNVISMTMLSSYSKIQNDLDTLRRTYFDVLSIVITFSAPVTVGIIVVAPDFVTLFLGRDWVPAIAVMQILAIWGYMRSLGATSGPLLKSIGRPDYNAKASFAKTVLLAILIYPATEFYGIVGTSVAVVLSAALTSEPYVAYSVLSELEASVKTLLWRISVPTAASLGMGATVVGVKVALPFGRSFPRFALLVAVGAASYAVILLSVDRLLDYGIRDLLVSVARGGIRTEAT
jgi:PST family polysaccharide transporter/lipopolysaccharide exporter